MQVRLYSLAGQLHNLDSAYTEKPITVQRLPSKLSSLAWDHSQQVFTQHYCGASSLLVSAGAAAGKLLKHVASAEHSLRCSGFWLSVGISACVHKYFVLRATNSCIQA